MADLNFKREGIEIIFDALGITIKKNGLTIQVPGNIVDECLEELQVKLDEENLEILQQIRNYKR